MTSPVLVAATDIHWLWDDRCAQCHGHSGEFSRRFLTADDGRLQGQHHAKNLRQFMQHHYLPPGTLDTVHAMLLAQAITEPRFERECSNCHNSAAQLVRDHTTLIAGDELRLRPGQTLGNFLQGHRRLQAADVEFFVKLLTRVAIETGKP